MNEGVEGEILDLDNSKDTVPVSDPDSVTPTDIVPVSAPVPAPEIFLGTVTRFAPSSACSGREGREEEGLYETVWGDGVTLYYGEKAYQNARILYEKTMQTSNIDAIKTEDIITNGIVTDNVVSDNIDITDNVKTEISEGLEESKKRKAEEVDRLDVNNVEEEGEGENEGDEGEGDGEEDDDMVYDGDGDKEGGGEVVVEGGIEGTVMKRMKTEVPRGNLTQSLMYKSKYSVPCDTVLKWR